MLSVTVHFDFASTLCYVAHRVMGGMAPTLADLGLELRWAPVDLARLAPFRRAEVVPEERRANAARVAAELGVPVQVPRLWPDSRWANAAALSAEARGLGPGLRERLFSSAFEQGQPCEDAASVARLAGEVGLALDEPELEEGLLLLERRTAEAAESGVTGVPTFMLGSWPFGGIQTEETMERVLARFASRARRGMLA